MKKNKQRAIRLEPDLEEWLLIDAATYGRTVAQSVRHYLRMEMQMQREEDAAHVEEALERG